MAYGPGEIVNKRYRILDKLGAGAHGVVYRARDLETRDEVALKFLGDGKALDPEYSRRIEREAIAMAKLRGTSAVYVHGLNVAEDGSLYLAMEMLAGKDLEAYLGDAERVGGKIKKSKLLELLRPVVDTLEEAHKQGIVHRDLKPSNVFIVDAERGGGVRLLDFGLAKMLDATALTADGMVAGTPSYIAPEAWKGNPRILDHRIDVYSLGVLVFRALCGRTPTPKGNMLDVCSWAMSGERPSLHELRPSLPRAIDTWVEKALAIDPNDRFQSVRALWTSLEGLLAERAAMPF
ncbi:MAG: serine/threonine-protein kinase [Polyangiaceae bacterium]